MNRQKFGLDPIPPDPAVTPRFEATVDALDVATMLASHWPAAVLTELLAGARTMAAIRSDLVPWDEVVAVLEPAVRMSSPPCAVTPPRCGCIDGPKLTVVQKSFSAAEADQLHRHQQLLDRLARRPGSR